MKILAAMSGGVDSSVAAALLVRQGHQVTGAYMKNWINEENIAGHCPWMDDIEDARTVASQIGIDFQIVNLMRDYREKVVRYLLAGYESGITPNPDVMCNREMKFGALWEWAREHGFEAIATGHYARRVQGSEFSVQGSAEKKPNAEPRTLNPEPAAIYRGIDTSKDQTYFLAMLRPEQVQIARFPIGHLWKSEVRAEAEKLGLKTAGKKDSQGICFIGEVKMEDFLRAFVPDKPGPIVNLEGKTLGEHRGLHLHTLGQRKGLRVPSNLYKQAYVVVAKRHETNELVIAIERPGAPLLWSRRCVIGSISTTGPDLSQPMRLGAQPRYRSPAGLATFTPVQRADGLAAELWFDEPQRALTPGQICALYDGDRLLGGGVFETIHHEQDSA